MTEPRDLDDLTGRLRGALHPTDEDRHDADRLVEAILSGQATPSGERLTRDPRRRARWVVPLLAASVAACLALGVGALARLQPSPEDTLALPGPGLTTLDPTASDRDPLVPTAAAGPTVGTVSCAADGTIRVETAVVEAQRDGVHLRWRTTAKNTTISWGDGGSTVAARTHDLTLDARPGRVTLSCSVNGNATMSTATLDVLDPAGSWLGGRSNLFCRGGVASPSWVIRPAQASTRREAVERLARELRPGRQAPIALGRAPIGYVGSVDQTWTIDFSVGPGASGPEAVVVDVRPAGADRFEAGPNWICMRGPTSAGTAAPYTPQGALPARTPDVVDLTCTDGRLSARAAVVRARAEGVLFRSASATPWTLHWGLPTDEVADREFGGAGATVTHDVEPGTIRLWCGQDRSAFVDIRVVDPDGMFLGGSLEHGCPTIAALDTAAEGWGNTPLGAALELARGEPRTTAVLGRAPIGYVAAARQAWMLGAQDPTGFPAAALTVAMVQADGSRDRFVARPDAVCGA